MNKYQEDYEEFIKSLKYIDELVDSLTIEKRKSLGATTWSIQGVLGRYINEEKDFIKELVDRETPMKPVYRIPDISWNKNEKLAHCPTCDWRLDWEQGCHNNKCRQRIDWSDEE